MTPRPPLSTPFPYTTLFRSLAVFGIAAVMIVVPDALTRLTKPSGNAAVAYAPVTLFSFFLKIGMTLYGGGDRKSTRLNSSHRCISYAVFCLKKKNNIVLYPL